MAECVRRNDYGFAGRGCQLPGTIRPKPCINYHIYPASWANIPNGQFVANESSIRSFPGIRRPQENSNSYRNLRIKERYSLNIRPQGTPGLACVWVG